MARAKGARKTRASPPKAAKTAKKKMAPKKASKKGAKGTVGKPAGDAAVQGVIRALPAWQRAIAARIDALIAREVPDVRRAIKWSMPTYGREGMGWFAYVAPYAKHVSFGFYEGTRLAPPPPEGSGKGMRHVKLRGAEDVDEAQLAGWVRQAAALPGWGGGASGK